MSKLILFLFILIVVVGGWFVIGKGTEYVISPAGRTLEKIVEKPLEKYSFEKLKKTTFAPTNIRFGDIVKVDPEFRSQLFSYSVRDPGNPAHRYKVSGLMNMPKKKGMYPVIVMFRGFVEKENYSPGEGTRRTAEAFARQGFITFAPDFLGYGNSDNPSTFAMEERFQTYITALQLLASVGVLETILVGSDEAEIIADTKRIGIFGHSNGGHIALSVLAITGRDYPTVLWAPVSKMFPYSILYFTDEFEDHGKALRRAVADFEKDYDAERYSVTNYFDWIKAPLQLHQGVDDEAVPIRWSNQLNESLVKKDIDVTYFTYPDENHNFNNGSWPTAVSRSVEFYRTHFR